jgi:hypothetical protein
LKKSSPPSHRKSSALPALRFSENCVFFVSATDPGVINLNIEPLLDALRGDRDLSAWWRSGPGLFSVVESLNTRLDVKALFT